MCVDLGYVLNDPSVDMYMKMYRIKYKIYYDISLFKMPFMPLFADQQPFIHYTTIVIL